MNAHMTTQEFLEEVRSGRTLFDSTTITGTLPDGTELENLSFKGTVFSRVFGEYLTIKRCDFSDAILRETSFPAAAFNLCSLQRVAINSSVLKNSNFLECDFTDASITVSVLSGCKFVNCWFILTYMRDSLLNKSSMENCTILFGSYSRMDISSILSMHWCSLPDELITECMKWDAMSHPDPSAFSKWSKYSHAPCPYAIVRVNRLLHFKEQRHLWQEGPPKMSLYELALALLRVNNKATIK